MVEPIISDLQKSRIGLKFGRLTIVALGNRVGTKQYFVCQCECGGKTETLFSKLTLRHTRSCGCLLRVRRGLSNTAEFRAWNSMRQRCNDRNFKQYADYGGRGITICERWADFFSFLADMGKKPTPKHTIDRIDNSKGYSPENCHWATRAEQGRNTRRNRWLTHKGETLCVADWEIRRGFKPHTIHQRLKSGWSVADAIETPLLI